MGDREKIEKFSHCGKSLPIENLDEVEFRVLMRDVEELTVV